MVASAGNEDEGWDKGGFKYNIEHNDFGSAEGHNEEGLQGCQEGNIHSLSIDWFQGCVVLTCEDY